MALTSYFNWETTLEADLNLGTSIFHEATPEEEVVLQAPDYNHLLLPPYHHYYNYNYNSDENYSFLDPSGSTRSNFLYPPPPHDSQLLIDPYEPLISLPDDPYYYHYYHHNYNDNQLLPCPKRQKYYFSSYDQGLMEPTSNNCFDGIGSIPEWCKTLVPVAAAVDDGCDGRKKDGGKTTTAVSLSVSAQSKAARERRRKITEKTQELGRLVPSASNMNTADMLHAAAKYLTYLKAQVHMLQLVNTLQEDKALSGTEDLQALLTSPFVEEKLYLKEKCFVPKEFVTTLKNLQDVQSRPSILNDLDQLIETDTEKEQQ